MTTPTNNDVRPTVLVLTLYCVLAATGTYLAYLTGLMVERSLGSEMSLLYFLGAFMIAMIVAFPMAMALGKRVFPDH